MKKSMLVALLLLLASFPLSAQELQKGPDAKPEAKKSPLLIESNFQLRARNQHDNLDKLTKDQLQYNVDVKIQLALDSGGHWHVVSRVKSGSTFESGWNDVGVGNDSKFSHDINVRQLYLQYENGQIATSVGALPLNPNAATKGVLSYDEDGWIDGARLELNKLGLGKWAKKVTVTVGRIDTTDQPNVFERGINTPNVIQVHVQGNLSDRVSYVAEATNFDAVNGPSEQYLRTMAEIATKDVLKFIDKVVVESLLRNSSQPLQGFAIGAQKALSSQWSLTGQYSNRSFEDVRDEKVYAPREDFYREGQQVSLNLTYKFKAIPVEWSFVAGKTIVGRVDGREKALGVFNTKGLRAETRLKIKF